MTGSIEVNLTLARIFAEFRLKEDATEEVGGRGNGITKGTHNAQVK